MPGPKDGATEVELLENEVKRLKLHHSAMSMDNANVYAEEFRKHVAEAREPFHDTHPEANPWTAANDKGCNAGGCTIC